MFATVRVTYSQAGGGRSLGRIAPAILQTMPLDEECLVMPHSTSQLSSANTPAESKITATSPIMAAPLAAIFE